MGVWKKTQCNNCGVSCGMEVEIENNQIVNVRPDPDSPRSKNYMCRKGRVSKYFLDHGDRLNYPLKKVDGKFVRISWEQAYKEIAEKLNGILAEHGPRSFAACGYCLGSDQSEAAIVKPFLKATGSQYLYNPIGIEFCGNWWAHGKILGSQQFYTDPDEEQTEVLILWACNTYVTHNVQDSRNLIREFSENPDKMVITVDPRLSETARMSDMHIAPRYGCDSLLLRAMIAIILEKGWQDQKYIDERISDWDKAKVWFENFDIDGALETCRVPRKQIEDFCRILTTRKWGLHEDLGVFCARNNTMTSYLLLILMAVCGMLLVPGGNIIMESFTVRGETTDESNPNVWRTVETNRFPVLGVYPAGCLAAELNSEREDRLRAVFFTMANPLRSYPDTHKLEEGCKKLELMVVVDITMTETAELADYVLPAKTGFEQYAFNTFILNYPNTTCTLKHPVIGQVAERRESVRIFIDIAKEMGLLPPLPKRLYRAAEKAVATGDRISYFMVLLTHVIAHKEQKKLLPLIIGETLGTAMGSVTRSMCWAALLTSYLGSTGMPERAGYTPGNRHKLLQKVPKFRNMMVMDSVFEAVDKTPQGVVCAVADREENFKLHVKHPDGKLHLYCDEINDFMPRITPAHEEAALTLTDEYPMLMSAGRHSDDGHNTTMRNPKTYEYRQPYTVAMNPEDAQRLGIREGDMTRITTKAGTMDVPAEITWQAAPGYMLVCHHFGLKFQGKTYGQGVNRLTSWEDMDEITGNPFYRYVPCRIEKIKEGEPYCEIIH